MKCQKCFKDFPEKEIHTSHDIPKYLGGTDKDGRHHLCEKCHKEYEQEVLNMVMMNFLKELPKVESDRFQWCARRIRDCWFKKRGEDDGRSL